jgi:hypothetical protein
MLNDQELLKFKNEVHVAVLRQCDSAIAQLRSEIENLRESAKEETRSSAGDKYETGRSMMMLEMEKLSAQLQERTRVREAISAIKSDRLFEKAAPGAIIQSKEGYFYLMYGMGTVNVEGQTVMTLSPQSPLGKSLLGKATADEFLFNNRPWTILKVF